MQNDKTTLKDLSIFTSDGSEGVFTLIDHAVTQAGRDMLRRQIHHPPDTYEQLLQVQDAVKFWTIHPDVWPNAISNGTLVMLDNFFESSDHVAGPPSGFALLLSSFFQKMLNKQEFFLAKFSLSHLSDFLNGCIKLSGIADMPGAPDLLVQEARSVREELRHRLVSEIVGLPKDAKYTVLAQLSFRARREMKSMVLRLTHSYARMDAWFALAKATMANEWTFPELLPQNNLIFDAKGLRHPLLKHPVSYDIAFAGNHNFLLLTGANMSGKTTFMRAIGVSALLAHLGMGVPAASLRISFMHGIITNMQVEDNILKGESYFFAEVQRMKNTAEKLLKPEPHLVLMDELFKGTNVHDAYECTKAVLECLLRNPKHLMILSTHLYEVAQQFSDNKDVIFSYFVTNLSESGAYEFTYELKDGISNDRIGYRILQKEGVIDLLSRA